MAYTKIKKMQLSESLSKPFPSPFTPPSHVICTPEVLSPPSYDIPRGALSQSRVISLPLLPLHYAYSPLHTLTLTNFFVSSFCHREKTFFATENEQMRDINF